MKYTMNKRREIRLLSCFLVIFALLCLMALTARAEAKNNVSQADTDGNCGQMLSQSISVMHSAVNADVNAALCSETLDSKVDAIKKDVAKERKKAAARKKAEEQARKQTEKTRDATLGDSLSAAVETASDDDLSKDGKAAAKDSEKIKAVASWGGKTLSRSAGSITGPSGKETYYNLDMSGVIRIMRGMGFSEEEYPYEVRSDGAKTLGGYVMVAANLGLRPRGTFIQTSLGTGLVCDTGGFASSNRTQLDLATNW